MFGVVQFETKSIRLV